MDEDYEKRQESALKLIRLCLDLLAHNARETVHQRGIESFKDKTTYMTHEKIELAYFVKENMPNWSIDVKQMMSRYKDDYFLNQYREDNQPVDTVTIKIGDEVVGRVIIPLR